jgi:PAT family beta-lactamase induction signal transducer AmpG
LTHGLLALPWALKFVWAPVVDRWWWPRVGRRHSWILPMQLAATLGLIALPARTRHRVVRGLDGSDGGAQLDRGDIATDGMAVVGSQL